MGKVGGGETAKRPYVQKHGFCVSSLLRCFSFFLLLMFPPFFFLPLFCLPRGTVCDSPHSWPENPTTTTAKPLASASSFRPNTNERRSVTTGPRLFSSLFPSKFWCGFSRSSACVELRRGKDKESRVGREKEGRKEGPWVGRRP